MSDQANFQDNVAELRQPSAAGRRFGKAPPAASPAADMASAKDGLEALRQELHERVKDALAEPKLHEDEIQYELGCWVRLIDTTALYLWVHRRLVPLRPTYDSRLWWDLLRRGLPLGVDLSAPPAAAD